MIIKSQKTASLLKKLNLGALSFNAFVEDASTDLLDLISNECTIIRKDWTTNSITSRKEIAEARKAYKVCGKDPSRYRPSADSLMRRILKGNNLYKVNNVVDTLNLISLQSGLSIGGYDTDKTKGQTIFDIGLASDEYYGIGRGLLNIENLPVLRDQEGAFGSPTSDSQRTMITASTINILFVFFDFGCSVNLSGWMQRCEGFLGQYCKGTGFKNIIIELNEKL